MMPTIDVNDPMLQKVVHIYSTQLKKALDAPQSVEEAVLPIYWILRSPKMPEQVGSGVVVQIKGEYFVFSASHVFDDIGSYGLLVGTGGGSALATLYGERFSSLKGRSGTHNDDPIDASVFHIQSIVPDHIKQKAISLDDFDISPTNGTGGSIHLATGYRVKKSRTLKNQANARRECYPSVEYGENEYSILKISKETHIAIAYPDKVLVGKEWQYSPKLTGMSGGAIIRVEGVALLPPFLNTTKPKQLLSAILIASKPEKPGTPGAIIGTRIGVHLGLIQKFLPGLLDSDI